MKELIERLIETGIEQSMDESREELKKQDVVYRRDKKDTAYLEERSMELDLTREQRMIVEDLIACMQTADSRYADISYIAGIMDAVRCLSAWGMLKV